MSPGLGLKASLASWRPPAFRVPPEPSRLIEEVQRIRAIVENVTVQRPPSRDLEETLREVRAYWARKDLASLPRLHRRRVPFVLFFGPPPRLGDDPHFVQSYLSLLSRSPEPRVIAGLLHVFLQVYPRTRSTFSILAGGLAALLQQTSSTRLMQWKERCEKFGLLHEDGPERVAKRWMIQPTVLAAFEETGLQGDLQAGGFALAAYDHLLSTLRNSAGEDRNTGALIETALAVSRLGSGDVLFPSRRVALAEALLLPFVSASPEAAIKERLKGFLHQYYGHPKVKRHSWHGIDEDAQRVFLRWVVGDTLEAFFGIVDDTAKPEHWEYRRAFWLAYYKNAYISDAWVVLGRQAAGIARQRLEDLKGSYALLKGGQSTQSVLLMRLGGLTIAEWSHAGSCRIWREGDPFEPDLYAPEYDAIALRAGGLAFTHHTSDRGRWQSAISDLIATYTGIRVSAFQYMPHGRTGGYGRN